jgi:hypothetical protein
MRPRLLISLLVLALSSGNADNAFVCAAYCMFSASVESAASHHHEMKSDATIGGSHAHYRGAPCAECPAQAASSPDQTPDCTSLVEIQAINERSFALNATNSVHATADDAPAVGAVPAFESKRSLFGAASPPIRNSSSAVLLLRI